MAALAGRPVKASADAVGRGATDGVGMSRSSYSSRRIVDKATITAYCCVVNEPTSDHARRASNGHHLPEE